jgi:hypothetical protein
MAVASGSMRQIAHVKEVSVGTDPATAYTVDRFLAAASLSNDIDSLASSEMRSDRGVGRGVLGARHCKGSFPFELSYGTYDDWLESALCSAWVAAGTAVTGQSVTVVAGTTNTMAATAIGTGLAVGDWIKVSGFTGAYVANNGFFRVTAQATALITLGEAVDASGASRLVAASAQTAISVQKMAYLAAGSSKKSLSVESANTDISMFQRALGFMVNKLSLSFKLSALITGTFEGIGFSLPAPAGTKYRTGTDVAASTTIPIPSYNASSFLFVDGVPAAICTSLDIALDNGMEELLGIFQTSLYDILMGRSKMTGSMTIALTSSAMLAKVLANTHIALRIQVIDATGAQGYAIDIPNIRLDAPSEDVAENKITQTFTWSAEPDSTAGTLAAGVVNCKISRLI